MGSLECRKVAAQKEDLLNGRIDPSTRKRIAMMNYDVEDAARLLRRTRNSEQAAKKKLEDLNDKHWALLTQHQNDLEMEAENQNENKSEEGDVTKAGDLDGDK